MTGNFTEEEIDTLEHGYRPLTKTGGYKEIPRSIVEELAGEVGLPLEEIPEIEISETARGASIERLPSGELKIVLARYQPKPGTKKALRHELAHTKLGIPESGSFSTYGDLVKTELEAKKLERGRDLTAQDIEDVGLTLVLEEGLSPRDALSMVYWAALELGASKISVGRAYSWMKRYFRERKQTLREAKRRLKER